VCFVPISFVRTWIELTKNHAIPGGQKILTTLFVSAYLEKRDEKIVTGAAAIKESKMLTTTSAISDLMVGATWLALEVFRRSSWYFLPRVSPSADLPRQNGRGKAVLTKIYECASLEQVRANATTVGAVYEESQGAQR
jgi:hypothetical protein